MRSIRLFFIIYPILLSIIILPSNVNALTTLISGDYFTGDIITTNNITYYIQGSDPKGGYNKNYTSIQFINNQTAETFKVKFNSCKNISFYEFCYIDNYYNFNKNRTYEGRELEPSIKIKVYYHTPSIQVKRPIILSFDRGKNNYVTVNFSNTGTGSTKIEYFETIPSEFSVNCNYCNNNQIYYTETIGPGSIKSFTYNIIQETYKNASWSADYKYMFNGKSFNGSFYIKSTVQAPYIIKESISSQLIKTLGDSSRYSINISNTDKSATIDVDLNVYEEKAKGYEGFIKDNNYYIFKGKLSPGDSKALFLDLDTSLVGYYPIKSYLIMKISGYTFNHDSNINFTVKPEPLGVTIITDKQRINSSNDPINLVINIANNDPDDAYQIIFGTINDQEQFYIERLNSNKAQTVFNNSLYLNQPFIIVNGVYKTMNYQELKFTVIQNITIDNMPNYTNKAYANISSLQNISQNFTQLNNTGFNNTLIAYNRTKTNIIQKSANNSQRNAMKEDVKKDFLTNMFDSIDNFFANLFKKK